MKNLFVYSTIILILISCGAKHSVTSTDNTVINHSNNMNSSFFNNIKAPANFDVIKVTSKIKVENGSLIPTLNATFYIENNKKIWTNISALFGLTGARAIATPTGIKAYERIKKTYIDSDFTYLNRMLGVDFLNYASLQNLLLGKTFVPVDEQDYSFLKTAQGYSLKSLKAQEVTIDKKKSAYNVSLNYDNQLNLNNVILSDANSDNQLEVQYTNWITVNNLNFPKNVKIIIKNKKTDQIYIENTKFDFSTMDTPYAVPPNYTKTEIK